MDVVLLLDKMWYYRTVGGMRNVTQHIQDHKDTWTFPDMLETGYIYPDDL